MFQKDLYDKSLPLYTLLMLRKAEEMEIVFSNIGLAYQKLSKNDLAIKYYQESLKVKDYMKTKQRLFYLYLNLEKIDEA